MLTKEIDIAVIGATGLVGSAVLEDLQESDIPVGQLYPLASEQSQGKSVSYGKHELSVRLLEQFDFSQVQLCFFCVPAEVAAEYLPKAVAAGCYCIDFSSHSRLSADVPLIVKGVNEEDLDRLQGRVVASPDSSVVHLAQIVSPLLNSFTFERINAVVLRAVSEIGRKGITELSEQSIALFNLKPIKHEHFAAQIAFNVLPHRAHSNQRDTLIPLLSAELARVLDDEQIQLNVSLVQVPVFYGHSMMLQFEFGQQCDLEQVKALLARASDIHCVEQKANRPDSVSDAVNQQGVFIGSVRPDPTWPDGINLWAVADNIHQGAAINGVQIAQILVKSHL